MRLREGAMRQSAVALSSGEDTAVSAWRETEGLIVRAHGRHFAVEVAGGEILECVLRGRKLVPACGDRAVVTRGRDGAVIESLHERRSLFYRASEFREKIIAANVTQVVMVLAGDPPFSSELLDRWLVVAEANDCRALLIQNKIDLPGAAAASRALAPYAALGYTVLPLCAKSDISALPPLLERQHSVLIGQSGMGKSTLLNALLPEAGARTGEISAALGAGRHTTTHTALYWLDRESWLIDSPGMQEFGLHHLSLEAIAAGFREFTALRDQCRFRDCAHEREPGCALRAAVAKGQASEARFNSLLRCLAERRAARDY